MHKITVDDITIDVERKDIKHMHRSVHPPDGRVMTEWYREQLKEMIPGLIKKWERKIGVKVHEWGVKQMKTKWGSCNLTAKRVWVNLELAKRPPLFQTLCLFT